MPHLLDYVAAQGWDVGVLSQFPGLKGRDLHDPDTRVTERAAAAAWRLAEKLTGDDALGIHVAEVAPKGALDLLEYAFRSSPTLGAALEELARYKRILSSHDDARLYRIGDLQIVAFSDFLEGQRAEFSMAFLLRVAREATEDSLVPLHAWFAHQAPDSLYEHHAFFRAPLGFGESSNQLAFDVVDMARPLRSADPALLRIARHRLEKILVQSPVESVSSQVREQLLERRPDNRATAAAIGRQMGISERTLHRRLHAEATSFRSILEAVRRELATALLRERRVGIAEVAFLLGYSEVTAFHRSFRRWTGQTPQAFRIAARLEDDRATA
jgi:AraC-like DNA-binding protein